MKLNMATGKKNFFQCKRQYLLEKKCLKIRVPCPIIQNTFRLNVPTLCAHLYLDSSSFCDKGFCILVSFKACCML